MAKKINMTPYEASLFSELKKLSKQANQRILRIEKLTKVKDGFAVKQLKDYLESENLKTWTKKGRIGASKTYTKEQMQYTIKAIKQFLKNKKSTLRGIKQYKVQQEKVLGKTLSYKQINILLQSELSYSWIYDYFGTSERSGGSYFWDWAREMKNEDFDSWCDKIMVYITDKSLDDTLKKQLKALYYYAKGVKG